jgi:hypothetical protein
VVRNRLRITVLLLVLGLAFLPQAGALSPPAYAQDYGLCPATGSPMGPFDVTSYDPEDYRTVYAQTFELAAVDGLFPGDLYFGLPPLETGPRLARTPVPLTPTETATPTPPGSPAPTETATPTPPGDDIPTPASTPSPTPFPTIGPGLTEPYVPPTILKAIGWVESSWSQAAFAVPYGGIGPALISADCGYGIMQVTTGMQNTTGEPTREQLMVGSHFAYNIARGTRILVDIALLWPTATLKSLRTGTMRSGVTTASCL